MSNQEQVPVQLQSTKMQIRPSFKAKLHQTEADLLQAQQQLEQMQLELNNIKDKLQLSQAIITAMQTSKFWMLRRLWFKTKKIFRLPITEEIVDLPIEYSPSQVIIPAIPTPKTEALQVDSQPANYKQELSRMYASTLQSFLASGCQMKLPTDDKPLISIILILYNRAELTFQCLRSLRENFSGSFEVIIVDNASGDDTGLLLDRLEGVKIIRNQENLHFLLGCNQASEIAEGKYILFLNNDAQVQPASIDSAVKTIESSDDIGAVGGKIILLDGTLQEAGSIIWQDASCFGYGRGESPFAPDYMFMRDVDYCSGAFLLTQRQTFLQLGGFDTDFQPAYYEETDYCLKLWKLGKRVVYDPNAVILHFEFASSKSSDRAIQMQVNNREVFLKKHQEYLATNYLSYDAGALIARTANRACQRVLFIDDRVPHSSLGSGFPRAREILLTLVNLGYFVTFYPLNVPVESWDDVYEDIPKVVEVMMGYGLPNLEEFLQERAGYYDIIIVSRPHNMQVLKPILESHHDWFTNTKIIYDAEAIFAIRTIAKQRLDGEQVTQQEVDDLVSQEMQLGTGVDAIISVSEAERQKFLQAGFKQVYTLGHAIENCLTQKPFEERSDILFVGAIHDCYSPNADSVLWFVKEVFPKIQDKLGLDIKFLIVGNNSCEAIMQMANDNIKVIGKVDDLTDYYNQARIFIAPTRFAAGIPFKVHSAAAHGVPIVCTSLIASQVGWYNDVDLLVADTPETFADKCIQLYTQPDLWESLRLNAIKRVEAECSLSAFVYKLKTVLQSAQD
jgi:GT2 family glycosyltransferase